MLKRLELVGFKSFADKTRFDFAPGVTGVVGPNGSGKSNVVDAVRWIMGEQSAKSLRGGEMADVIFNGSSSRKSLGMAEVTVAFDNSRRLLKVDADEVQLTRRVYRDGTGEYLINGQMARLKDIKEMFLGSGAGSGGYTIIAQGRVDELLQSSTRDRREIFDEAAGISRFKAKKTETLRKLASVDLNLTRSRDKLDSLGVQLRTLRLQATKARQYKEHADRLRDLRVGLGGREYRELTAALAFEQEALAALIGAVSHATTEVERLDRRAKELDWSVARGEEAIRHHDARLADARQQIAGSEASVRHERTAAAALQSEVLRVGRSRAEIGFRIRAVELEAARAAADATSAEERLALEQHRAADVSAALGTLAAHLAELESESAAGHVRQFDLVRQSAAARAAAEANRLQVERLQHEYTNKRHNAEQKSAQRSALAQALNGLSQADADIQARLAAARIRLAGLHADREAIADQAEREQARLEVLRVRQGDLRGRIDILEDLERSHEGLGAGVRQVLARLGADRHSDSGGPIVGLVADLLTVSRDSAALVELALGETAQRFVVRSADAIDAFTAALGELPGRVGFVPILPEPASRLESQSAGRTVAGLATCDHPECVTLPVQLLGHILLADTLADARRLSALHPSCRVLAQTGELLEPGGAMTVGPFKSEAGLVSRKSELRELRSQYRALSERVAAAEVDLAELRRRGDEIAGFLEAGGAEIALLSDEAGGLTQRIALQQQQVHALEGEIELLHAEGAILERQVQEGEAAWVAARMAADGADRAAAELSKRLDELKNIIGEGVAERDRRQQAHTAAQVALSRAAADRDRTRDRLVQVETELRKRKIEAVDLSAVDRTTRNRLTDATLAALRASSSQADAYREKEVRERLIADLSAQAAAARDEREQVRDRLQLLRQEWQEKQAAAHARELAVQDLSGRRAAIALRIREDYGIDLAADEASAAPANPEASDPSTFEVNREIDDLKRKLARLGSVNMEALEELTRVEAESAGLQAQHDDLNAARHALQQAIDAINADSRKLFVETLTAVRGYFQELFRKLFGGGQADIILEDESDVLESGIEITARPPGKDLRALSLLSGGEKTLTAVALLLAIFRNKPSPFCILDEVDAALDEANTQRLAGVLREFLDRSQFIVVTHKKRTMAAADRLWGVTMQESGVSRLLPMRFEDWPEEEARSQRAAA
jgi:chromosome segregation protein